MKKMTVVLIVLFGLAWSPWLTQTSVERIITKQAEIESRRMTDGCWPSKFTDADQVPFGLIITVESHCGIGGFVIDKTTFYISPIGTMHSLRTTSDLCCGNIKRE